MEEKYSITSWINACLVGFQMEGWDTALIIQQAEIDTASLNSGYCSIDIYNAIFKAAEKRYGESAGIVARKGVLPNTFHSFSLAMMSAISISEGLKLLVKHNKSICNVLEFFVTEKESSLFGFRVCDGVSLEPAVATAVLASILKTARFISPRTACIVQVEMAHAKPENADVVQSYFNVPIKWQQSQYALHYDATVFDAPSLHANHALMLKSEQNWIEEISGFENIDFLVRTRAFIKANVSEKQLDIEYIAEAFGMSVRTFQRRLKIEGTTFKELHDDARKAQALALIQESNIMTSRAADMLCFADVGSFSRAFKRWYGQSPEHFRRQKCLHSE